MSGAVAKPDAQPSGDPIGTAQERELIERPYGAGFLKLACPGDQQDEPTWILRFSDRDCREQVFIGKDAEREAWAAWNRYAPSYNCYLFQIASIEAADDLQSRIAEVERLTARVRDLEAAAQPFADSIVFDPDKKRGDRHWATFGTTTNIDQVMRLQAALSQHRKL